MLYRARKAGTLTLGQDLAEGSVGTFIILACCGTFVDVVGNGAGIRSGYCLQRSSVCIDINLTVSHINQEDNRRIIAVMFNGISLRKG